MNNLLKISLFIGLLGLLGITTSQNASAVTGADFNPGYIIDDSIFYNENAYDTNGIQTFLNTQMPNCDTNGTRPASEFGRPDITRAQYAAQAGWQSPPFVCMRDYRQNTPPMEAASGLCGPMAAGTNQSAAQIINNVSKACRISPHVLLVLLQKEQSLVTDSWPLNSQYRNATGFACPDTAPCNPAYNGFFYQVYHAARQFQVYKAYPNSYNYVAGRVNNIYYNPDLSRCGSSPVFIQNQATAALYIYTPYQPNASALNNLYGTGDSCGAYGNRNFWRLFNDWFGSTTYSIIGNMKAHYDMSGGVSALGQPRSNEGCGLKEGWCHQDFEYGVIYRKDNFGGFTLRGDIWKKWTASGKEWSPLGYPTSNEQCGQLNNGCSQKFQNGLISWTPARGALVVNPSINTRYEALGGINSFGQPLINTTCNLMNGGCYQEFDKGSIYWTATGGSRSIIGGILTKWKTSGKEWGQSGYPTSNEACAGTTCSQQFEKGSIYWVGSIGAARIVLNSINTQWQSLGGINSFGYPLHDSSCGLLNNGCYQEFQKGVIYWSSATGARSIIGGVLTTWRASGKEWGQLGYPTGNEILEGGNPVQYFQKGKIIWANGRGTVVLNT